MDMKAARPLTKVLHRQGRPGASMVSEAATSPCAVLSRFERLGLRHLLQNTAHSTINKVILLLHMCTLKTIIGSAMTRVATIRIIISTTPGNTDIFPMQLALITYGG